jgi:hypothetical protein
MRILLAPIWSRSSMRDDARRGETVVWNAFAQRKVSVG